MEVGGILVLIGSFFLLMFLNVPIAFSLGISSVITVWYLDLPTIIIFQKMLTGLQSFTFLAVPFFIMVGLIMGEGGISTKLIKFSNLVVGRIRGGLAMVNVLVSMLFGGISGSSVADVSSIGTILIPMMREKGYDDDYSVAVTVTSSIQGVIIPPSQNMIYYSLAAGGVSVGKLFMAGYIPGILFGITLMILTYFLAIKRGYPKEQSIPLNQAGKIVLDALLGLTTVVIIIGGIVFGVFTATESAAIAVVYVLFLTTIIYRSLNFKKFVKILKETISTLSVIIAVIATSSAFGWLLAYLNVPELVMNLLMNISPNRAVALLIINLFLLIIGMFMDMGIAILLVTPILLPVVTELGMDPIQFGIVLMIGLGIGLVTPPVGTSLFVGCSIAGIKLEDTIKILIPFYLVMLAVLMLVTYWPDLVMFLPNFIFK
ncbi:membrane protein [Petrotoga sp. HWH.PT.55.6.1]|uniref:TRAP transporter large permease n=1 Tax=unclassified Petrotoga TaxID=2620614 RepID=UPI000CA02C47|nr:MULTISPECIES: TRAP transporter large permease [unclassified Petrotoga]PNR94107.1 membrane protein [Petrotoga sp. HWHPT.55.6.3]RPD35544.1 membrane protein [Petrotoga sp. HWH.PT.55.6.1]